MSLEESYRTALAPLRQAHGRIPLLVNDLVVEEQLCHLRCTYCLTEEYNLLMAVPDAQERLTTDRHTDWLTVLDRYDDSVDAPILRVSGGEFFWLPGSDAFIEKAAERYETVQVITNGVLLKPERLERLAAIENFQLNLSLDGHTHAMNIHRFRTEAMFRLVLSRLDHAVELGIPVEVQAVLTAINAPDLPRFCEFLLERYGGAVRLYAFPVRGKVAGDLACPPGNYLEEVVERYDEFHPILPPRAAVAHVADFIRTGERTLPCSIPATMLQLFGDGNISACPHAWLTPMGNVVKVGNAIDEHLLSHEHYSLFLQPRPRFSFCKGCVTPSDVVNLYLEGDVSDEEIAHCFLYRGPSALERLRQLRAAFRPVTARLQRGGAAPRRHIPVRSA